MGFEPETSRLLHYKNTSHSSIFIMLCICSVSNTKNFEHISKKKEKMLWKLSSFISFPFWLFLTALGFIEYSNCIRNQSLLQLELHLVLLSQYDLGGFSSDPLNVVRLAPLKHMMRILIRRILFCIQWRKVFGTCLEKGDAERRRSTRRRRSSIQKLYKPVTMQKSPASGRTSIILKSRFHSFASWKRNKNQHGKEAQLMLISWSLKKGKLVDYKCD